MCETKFTVPADGVDDLPKNWFIERQKEFAGSPEVNCDRHPESKLQLYCSDCQTTACCACVDEFHKSHDYSDTTELENESRRQIADDIEKMVETSAQCYDSAKEQRQTIEELVRNSRKTEAEIRARAELLKKDIDEQKNALLRELASLRNNRIKEIKRVVEGLEKRVLILNNTINYLEDLKDKGTAADVAQQANPSHNRACELTQLDSILPATDHECGSTEIAFTAAEIPTGLNDSFIGKIHKQLATGKWSDFFYYQSYAAAEIVLLAAVLLTL